MQKKSEKLMQIKKIFGSGLKNKFQIFFFFFTAQRLIFSCFKINKMKTFSERDQNKVKSSLNQEKYQSVD